MVANDPTEVHMAHKPRRQTLVVALEREGQLVHLPLEDLYACMHANNGWVRS